MAENEGLIVSVLGTTSVSFEQTAVGDKLEVRAMGKPASNRPVAGGRFKGTAYLVFKGKTKIGKLDDKAVAGLRTVPNECRIVSAEPEAGVMSVMLESSE